MQTKQKGYDQCQLKFFDCYVNFAGVVDSRFAYALIHLIWLKGIFVF